MHPRYVTDRHSVRIVHPASSCVSTHRHLIHFLTQSNTFSCVLQRLACSHSRYFPRSFNLSLSIARTYTLRTLWYNSYRALSPSFSLPVSRRISLARSAFRSACLARWLRFARVPIRSRVPHQHWITLFSLKKKNYSITRWARARPPPPSTAFRPVGRLFRRTASYRVFPR